MGPKKTGARPRFFQPATLPNRRAGEVSRWLRLNATRDFFDLIPPSSAGVSKQTIAINGQITLSPNPGNKGLPKKTGAKPRFSSPSALPFQGRGRCYVWRSGCIISGNRAFNAALRDINIQDIARGQFIHVESCLSAVRQHLKVTRCKKCTLDIATIA